MRQSPAHPAVGNVGVILAGLSPLGAYLSYWLTGRGKRTRLRILLAVAIGALAFIAMQYIGLALLQYALGGQVMLLG